MTTANPGSIARSLGDEVWKKVAGWARLHHVYFLLATFDVLAVATGLQLSHHLNGLFASSIESSVRWGNIQGDIGEARRAAATANAPGNDIFATRNLAGELANFDRFSVELEQKLDVMKRNAAKLVPKSHSAEQAAHFDAIDEAFYRLQATTAQLFNHYRRGEIEASAIAMSTMDRENGALLARIGDFSGFLHSLQFARQKADAAAAAKMQRLEMVLGAMMIFMVGGVTVFGHWIGKKFQRQYDALDAAHARQNDLVGELRDSHAEVVRLNTRLENVNVNLEERVKERTRDLEEANTSITDLNVELAQSIVKLRDAQDEIIRRGKLAQLGQLTATVAHEIRNPLGSVKTSTYLLERKLKDTNLGVEKQIERINNGVKRCDTIITELLDFARSKALATKPVELDPWLKSCVEEEAKQIPACVKIDLALAAPGANPEMDADRMRRVVINLVSNAAEAMVGKGDQMQVRDGETPTISVSSEVSDGIVRIKVRDNGPGISQENIKRIMEPLFTTKSFGVGLGLPAVEQILVQHGGGLVIESEPGEGATFIAHFPLLTSERKAA